MLAGILITIREGMEAFLIIGILLGYLKKTRQSKFSYQIWIGSLGAIIVSIGIATLFQLLSVRFSGRTEQIFEAATALVAVVVLSWMVLWMQKQSRTIKGELEEKVQSALSSNQLLALASLAFVAVLREGVETSLFLSALANTAKSGLLLGSILGLVIAAFLAYLIFNTSVRLNLRLFFIITGTLLIFISAGILGHAIRELEELGIVRGYLAQVTWNTSWLVADKSLAGKMLSVFVGYNSKPILLQIIAYIAYVVTFGTMFYGAINQGRRNRSSSAQVQASPSKSN